MTANYYYLIASLPALVFSAPEGMSQSAFVTECRRHVSDEDARELDVLLAGNIDLVRCSFSRSYLNGERQLRNAIVRARALRLGVDEKKFRKDHDGFRLDIESAVNDAFSRANPLERKLALDRFRWNLADELSAGDPFDFAVVLAYGVKLVLNEQWRALSNEAGRQRFDEQVGVVSVSAQEAAGWTGLANM